MKLQITSVFLSAKRIRLMRSIQTHEQGNLKYSDDKKKARAAAGATASLKELVPPMQRLLLRPRQDKRRCVQPNKSLIENF
jgi:hypothetical protein